MEQKVASSWRMSINEKKFIEHALLSDLRVDGRRPFDFRSLTINFGKEDGSSEVQLGHTRVMGYVTSQLVEPYRDRPNEGTLSIFTEFSPMADPAFEPGRPGEFAVELGRIIDRSLRESRAIDTESLCVLPGKFVWAIRIDLHVLDNGGNLVDAANVAALAALSTFRRAECAVGGEDGQQVIVHPPEVRDPLPLIIHHLPIAVTFAFFDNGSIVVIDPSYKEEAVMGGKMTVTMNSNGDVCAIQKAGGVGILQSVVMQCLRIAAIKAADISSKIKNAVDDYERERALSKVKRHSTLVAVDVEEPDLSMKAARNLPTNEKTEDGYVEDTQTVTFQEGNVKRAKPFIGGPSSWNPYSKGFASDALRNSPSSADSLGINKEKQEGADAPLADASVSAEPNTSPTQCDTAPDEAIRVVQVVSSKKSLQDAVKQKTKKKKNPSSKS